VSKRFTTDSANAALDAAGALPLEPYSGNMSKKWACQCKKCGKEIFPRMVNLATGSKACRHCHGPNPVDPIAAEAKMVAAGVSPLEAYPGYDKPWRVRCLKCGRTTTPSYSAIKKGQGGCFRCGTNYDDFPAHIYLVHDRVRKVVKIGITNEHAHRMKKYGGWDVIEFYAVATGKEAARIEAEVLLKWSTEMGLKPKLTRFELRSGGYTETADE
jgi:recombinational DNA repair protein (RecF pathway)